jgi:two-component system, chemotaxis family, CheB/CheR fusion protein
MNEIASERKKLEVEGFPIVGIGASAGGFEAFSRLLRTLPSESGMAYIFAQHLDPHHESFVADLLAKVTPLPVAEVQDGMKIVPDRVYILPPNKSVVVSDGHMKLEPRVATPGKHMPVDHMLQSLAEVHGARAIGVILSGNASDGTLGMKAIKAEGGVTFAQDPTTAKFDGMPRSAIAARCVDFVLPVEQIGDELARLGRHPYVRDKDRPAEDEQTAPQDASEYDRVFVMLKKASGVDFKHYKQTTIQRRIARRMLVHKIEHVQDYVKLLQEKPAEVEALYQDILIKVTRFFRDPEVFEFLQSDIFPGLFENRPAASPVRIWVPGCATGEEVYTIAICLLEKTGDMASNPPVQIFATDVSEQAIQAAREGKYLENISMDVSPGRLRRFFTQVDGGYQVSKPIRDLCIFAKQNMTSDPPFSKLDLISCRNVLIYLDSTLQKRVLPLFHYALKSNGYLVLGSSETVGSHNDMFTAVDKRYKVFAKKQSPGRTHVEFTTTYAVDKPPVPAAVDRNGGPNESTLEDAQRDADRIILSRFRAAGVVIDSNMEIVQFRGDTSPYLEHTPGTPSLNILKMARDGLSIELRALVHDAKTRGVVVSKDNIVLSGDKAMRTVSVEVVPLRMRDVKEPYFLILFELGNAPEAAPEPAAVDEKLEPSAELVQQRLKRLTDELSVSKQHLQSIIEEQEATNEELQSANEEVLSSNEELQSINEELETAKEELQSTNEELTTVNEELQNRNQELRQLNSDLTNLLASVSIPIIMIGSDLRIRRFTPLAEKLLSLIPTDIGRPLGDIKPRLDVPDLSQLVSEVIDSVQARELEVQDKNGLWYSMRIRPYKSRESKIEGAVIALVDINALKRSDAAAREVEDLADAIIQSIREPFVILDMDCKIRKTNQAFHSVFALNPANVEGHDLFQLGKGQWDIPELRKLVGEVQRGSAVTKDAHITHEFPHLGRKTLTVTIRRVHSDARSFQRMLLGIHNA